MLFAGCCGGRNGLLFDAVGVVVVGKERCEAHGQVEVSVDVVGDQLALLLLLLLQRAVHRLVVKEPVVVIG